MSVKIFNDGCLERFRKLELKNKVNLVCVDLPYGQTACKWDTPIDLNTMWIELKKICKPNCIYIFNCTTKFGYELIKSNELWFKYDLVWEKSKTLGFLSAKKLPLRKHEMIYIFSRNNCDDLDIEYNLGLREYAKQVKSYINKPLKTIDKQLGNMGVHKLYEFKTTQFSLPTEKNYNKLIDIYDLKNMEGFREYKSLQDEWETVNKYTYNPQKTEGKPYINNKKTGFRATVYGVVEGPCIVNNGDRYPISILKFNNPQRSIHPTQKPINLIEWIIKTYSNEGDTVMDFTMGSGTTGIACLNTGRNFIGIEKDTEIFKMARNRLLQHEITQIRH